MTDLTSLCAALSIDEAAARRVLESERGAADRAAPWYVLLLLGLGAWITALIMIVFVAVFLHFIFDLDEPALGSAAIGAVMFVCGLFIQAKTTQSVFAEQFAIALVAAGAGIAAGSIGFEFESWWSAAVGAAALTAIDIWRGRYAQQQFLLAALAMGLGIAALSDAMVAHQVDIVALSLPAGVLFYLRPPAKEMRPTAAVLLLALPTYALLMDSLYSPAYGGAGWPARAIALATVLVLAWLHGRARAARAVTLRQIFVALVAAIACVLLPPGGSAALVILMLAFVLGHWPLAIVGLLLEVYFVPRFYDDLALSLLTKSWILLAVGAALLAGYAVWRRSGVTPS